MTRLLLPTLVLLLVLGTAYAEDAPQPPRRLPSIAQVADAVQKAAGEEDTASLERLATWDGVDPWLVADELCDRTAHGVADRYARAAPRPDLDRLPAYVASRKGVPKDDEGQEILAAMNAAAAKASWSAALEAAGAPLSTLDSVVRIRIAYGRGSALLKLERRKEGAEALLRAGTAARDLGWLRRALPAFHQAGLAYYQLHAWNEAAAAWASWLEVAGLRGDRPNAAVARLNLSMLEQVRGDREAALVHATEAQSLYRALGDPRGADQAGKMRGEHLTALGRHAEALAQYEALLKRHGEQKDQQAAAETLGSLAVLNEKLGDFREARRRHEETLAIERRGKQPLTIADRLHRLGNVNQNLGAFQRAVGHYDEALGIQRAAGLKQRLAYTLAACSLALERLGRYADSLDRGNEALQFLRELGDDAGRVSALISLGNVEQKVGNFEASISRYREALEMERAAKDQAGIAGMLNNIGAIHDLRGDHDEALVHFEKALAIYRQLDVPLGIATTLQNIGGIEHFLEKNESAHRRYQQSLEIFQTLGNTLRIAQAHTALAAVLVDLDRRDDAANHYQEALRLLEDAPNRDAIARSLWGLVILHLENDEFEKAAAHALAAIEQIAPLSTGLAEGEGAGTREYFAELFDAAYCATLETGNPGQLATVMEHGRAGSLREALGARGAIEQAVLGEEALAELTHARSQEHEALASYRRARSSRSLRDRRDAHKAWQTASAEVERIARKLQRKEKQAARLSFSEPDDLETIRSRLLPGEALVYYALTSARAAALVVDESGSRAVKLSESTKIAEGLDALLDGDQGIDPGAVPALRRLLVEPLALSSKVKRVLISPMGRLADIPFALLFPDHDIAYTPSGTTHGMLLQDRKLRGKRVLGIGDPDYQTRVDASALRIRAGDVTNLPALPATRAEVEAVADVRLLGAGATEEALRERLAEQGRWRALHFACHGLVNARRPMLSALALTATEKSDGFLTGLEVLRLGSPSDLVVLSACDTARGRTYETEGVLGLTSAFLVSGTPRVLSSLWKVDDEATQALMMKFYELWNPDGDRTPLSPAAALRRAQAYVRSQEKWQHPRFWAAWVLWGLPE